MKSYLLFATIIVAFIISCGTSTTDDVIANFIPGTYVRQSDGEFGKSYDTLVISLQSKAASQYKIVRRWRYNRVRDGKPIEPEYKITETSAVFDAQAKALQESETLELLTFDIKKKLLFNGPNQFIKIK